MTRSPPTVGRGYVTSPDQHGNGGFVAWAIDIDRIVRTKATETGELLPDPYTPRPRV